MLRSLTAAALFSLASACAWGASSSAEDAYWDSYFSVWANDATATPQAVEKFYANRVNYYGHEMTRAQVYQDKLYLIRRWPIRSYHVVPGSVGVSCSDDHNSCQVTVVMDFRSENPALGVGVQGETTVSLSLIRQDGQMKIEREYGVPLLRSSAALDTSVNNVARTRQQLVEEGFETTLTRKYNPNSARPRIFDGAAEAKLIALACSPAPEGFARWSLRLLEEKVVELNIVEKASDNTIGRTLKKTPLNRTAGGNG